MTPSPNNTLCDGWWPGTATVTLALGEGERDDEGEDDDGEKEEDVDDIDLLEGKAGKYIWYKEDWYLQRLELYGDGQLYLLMIVAILQGFLITEMIIVEKQADKDLTRQNAGKNQMKSD